MSRSGYYKWLKVRHRQPEPDHEDYLLIKAVFDSGRAKYGFRTIQMKLSAHGIRMNHKKILRIKKKYRLVTTVRRMNPYRHITNKALEHSTCPNILKREFNQPVPFRALCTDVTFVPLGHRFAYLSVVKDVSSGEIVAWKLAESPSTQLVLGTLEHLKQHRHAAALKGALIHSDQGLQYTSHIYQHRVRKMDLIQSMSRKGNCLDNAPVESFFGHLKDELDYKNTRSFAELRSQIEAYMRYYNHERRQWHRKKMTPVEYRDHLLAQ